MSQAPHTLAGAAITELVVEVFRLNGRLLAAGDALVAPIGLTSARWQVLGAIAVASSPEPVARLARSMGLNRQGVQRIVDEMHAEGWLGFAPNPHHRRAKLVLLTEAGAALYAKTTRLQVPWADGLGDGRDAAAIDAAARLLRDLRLRLEGD